MENILHEIRNCPVAWKPLEELLVRTKGTKITATQMKELHEDGSPIKIFAGGKTVAFVNFGDIPEKDINRDPSIIVKSRGIIEFEYYDAPFSHKNEMWSYHSQRQDLLIKYAYYFLKANEAYFQALGNKMQMPQISTPDTDKYQIPIPYPEDPEKSIAIQSEIVRILDTFTAVTSELTSELTTRKKQYEYYRDKFLTPSDDRKPYVSLIEVAEYVKSKINSKEVDERTYIGVENLLQDRGGKTDSSYVPGAGILTAYKSGDVLIGNIRPYLKKIWHANHDGGTNGDVLVIRSKSNRVMPRYLYHVLSDDRFFVYNMQHAKGAKMPRGNKEKIMEYTFQVPSVEEQKRIVTILDKFDTLTHSITDGLPREIELRQKQYAYYRDLLFSFA